MNEHFSWLSYRAKRDIFAVNFCNLKMKEYIFYVYILSNWNNKVIYVGMTNNPERRLFEHKNKLIEGFTKKYNVTKLVYFEQTGDVNTTIRREKEIKKWRREKKNILVESMNPNWDDLSEKFCLFR